jgi:hypothetical protein
MTWPSRIDDSAEYLLEAGIAFMEPPNPLEQPIFLDAPTVVQITEANRQNLTVKQHFQT